MEDIQGGLLLASQEKLHVCKHCGITSKKKTFGCGHRRGMVPKKVEMVISVFGIKIKKKT